MADRLGIYPHEFRKKYVKKSDGFDVLKSRGRACILLSRNRCRVHPDHPHQCRTWPFWPQNLTRHIWYKEIRKRCPGVGKGRKYSEEEIESILRKKSLVS
jgi:Fe-S-cluster containining protein